LIGFVRSGLVIVKAQRFCHEAKPRGISSTVRGSITEIVMDDAPWANMLLISNSQLIQFHIGHNRIGNFG
jgi:hypothetical protein